MKNSWGNDPMYIGNNGYIYIIVAYLKLKAIAIMVHKEGLLKETKKELDL